MIFDSQYIIAKVNKKLEEEQRISSEQELINLLDPMKDGNGNVIADTHIPTEDLLNAFSELRLKLTEHMRLDDVLFLSDTFMITTKINRVLRSVCGHMIAMASCFNRKAISDKQMRRFLLDDGEKLKRINVFAWLYPYSTIVNVRDISVRGNRTGTHPEGFISVMEAFPLAFLISDNDETDCGLDNLSQYLTTDINEEVSVALHLKTAFHPGTRMLKHYLWPIDVVNGPYGAAYAIGGQEMDGSRIGVVKQ